MFDKKKETKQYSVSQEDVNEIMKSAHGEWLIQKLFQYAINGFNNEIANMQKNIVSKLSIDETKYDVDWSTLFKDSKIYTHPKPEPGAEEEKPKVEEKKEDAEPIIQKGSKSRKKN